MLEIIKNILSKLGLFSIVRKVFSGILVSIKSYFFRKNVDKTFKRLIEILEKEKIENFIVFGTLLGIIRENNFIKHDLDLDFGVWENCDFEKLQILLEKNNFSLKSEIRLTSSSEIEYQNYIDKNTKISIDFYKFTRKNKQTYYYEFLRKENLSYEETIKKFGGLDVFRFEYSIFKLKQINFKEKKINIIENYEEFFIKHYGKNYLTPIKNFDSREMTLKQKYIKDTLGIKIKRNEG